MRTLTARPLRATARISVLSGWPSAVGNALLRGRPHAGAAAGFDPLPHLEAAIEWIKTAHVNSRDGGIAAYYDLLRGCWRASYPETTGYTIPTLFACAQRLGRPELADLAVRLAYYLLSVRTSVGGVGHWGESQHQVANPIVFDTGQVIFGWLAAWRETGESVYLESAVAAADWLVSVQSPTGAWYRNQHLGVVKVIDVRVAWALIEVARATRRQAYEDAARRNLDWAIGQQLANGWFRHAAFSPGSDPFTHTIAYTAEGLLECGILLDEPTYVAAAEQVAHVMLQQQLPDGSLASTYDDRWRATTGATCLTGNCQLALLWMRLYERSADRAYLEAARRAVVFVAGTQDLLTSNPCIRGAIAGSLPIYGNYERMKFPNWAAKFFVDSLLTLEMLDLRTQSAGPNQ